MWRVWVGSSWENARNGALMREGHGWADASLLQTAYEQCFVRSPMAVYRCTIVRPIQWDKRAALSCILKQYDDDYRQSGCLMEEL